MNKTELEEAIKNGKSVWCVYCQYSYKYDSIKEIDFTKLKDACLSLCDNYFQYFEDKIIWAYYYKLVFKTKAEAEHYLNHANVKRVEQLPFVTWEEFDNGDRFIRFTGKNKEDCKLEGYQSDDKQTGFIDIVVDGTGLENYFYYNEENFYKAYDECVKLFKGEEI